MATREQIAEAIRRADAAGDADSVRKLGAVYRSMPTQAAPQKAPEKGFLRQAFDAVANPVAGFAQGRVGLIDMAAQGAGKIMSTVPTAAGYAADALGYDKAGRVLHDSARALANPPTIGGAIEAAVPTPPDLNSRAARLVAQFGGAANSGKEVEGILRATGILPTNVPTAFKAPSKPGKIIPKAAEVVDDAKKAGVRVMTSDVRPPRTFIGRAGQAIGERIPFAGTGSVREAQQAERVQAVRDLARDYGATVGDDVASPAIDNVMKDLVTRRGRELTRLKGIKDGVINNTPGAVPVGRASAAIDDEVMRLQSLKSEKFKPVIDTLLDWKQAIQGQPLKNIEVLRKQVGESFKAPELAAVSKVGQDSLNKVYGPLREDMGAFIKATGGQGNFVKWKVANDRLAGMAGELKVNSLKSVLNAGEQTPEKVASLLFSQKPSEVRRLYAGLTEAGRSQARTAILQRALEKSVGTEGLSPDRFSGQVKALGDSIGVFFRGDDLARVEGLNRVLMATTRAAQASVAPPTGVQAVPYAMGAGLTAAFGIPGGISAGAGLGLVARAYESAPVRNILLMLGKTKPGSAHEAALVNRATLAIAAVVSSNKRPVPAANANFTPGLAASEPDDDRNQ